MSDDEEIPFEFVQKMANALGYPIDERGNYTPPVGVVHFRVGGPKGIAKQVLQEFRRSQAVRNNSLRHITNRSAAVEAKRLAQLLWSESPDRSIKDIATRVHDALLQGGHKIKFSTCRTHAKTVHDELGLPTLKGRPSKKL